VAVVHRWSLSQVLLYFVIVNYLTLLTLTFLIFTLTETLTLTLAASVREVVKRRQRFEYKLQKRQKKKEDILAYIQYECALLQLIEIRRDKMK